MSSTTNSHEVDEKTDVEAAEKAPPVEEANTRASTRKRWYIMAGIILAAGLIAVAIAVPIVKRSGESKQNTTNSTNPFQNTTNSTNPFGGKTNQTFAQITGPFKSTLSLFDGITRGYANESEFKQDIANFARFLLKGVVLRNTGAKGFENVGLGRGGVLVREPVFEGAPNDGPEEGDTSAKTPGATYEGVDDYETNNQEEGIEEGDVMVTDGETVFAAYGDYVVMWEATTGQKRKELKVPPIEEEKEAANDINTRRTDFMPGYYPSRPNIRSLLLHDNKLIVIVEGHGYTLQQELGYPAILSDYLGTRLYVYDASDVANDDGELVEIARHDLNGRYHSVRGDGSNIHVVTFSYVNTYHDLIGPFERWNYPEEMTNDIYIETVRKNAEEKAIPLFLEKLTTEIKKVTSEVPILARISLWQSEYSGTDLESITYSEGVANNLAQIFSFDLGTTTSGELGDLSASGAFLPSYWGEVYADKEAIIVAGEGYDFSSDTGVSAQTTYLLAMALNGASSAPHSVGSVPGHVLDKYSLDILGNILRVATTVQRFWLIRPMIDAADNVEIIEESSTVNYMTMLELPGPDGNETGVMKKRGQLELGKKDEVFRAVRSFDNLAYAVTFQQTDPFYVMNLTDADNPEILSEINITGFSEYLHPMNDRNDMILAIGKEADDNGAVLGLQLTIFNMVDPRNAFVVKRHTIEKDPQTWSNSAGTWEPKAFRYNRITKRLSIPVDIRSSVDPSLNFNGFIVYVANETTIEESCRIENANEENDESCYYCASLQPRSMIFDGILMTANDQFVRGSDLGNCTKFWGFDVNISSPDGYCCNYWYY